MRTPVHRSRITHDRWLVSYADFITLLFGLFVVMYAFARSDQKKQHEVSAAIDAAFRSMGLPAQPSALPSANPVGTPGAVINDTVLSPQEVKADLNRIQGELHDTLGPELAAQTVSVAMGHDGLVISLRESGFFGSGSATPKPESLPVLRRIAAALEPTSYSLRIEGHTDNVPIHNAEFDSNWELSTARATRIARLLLDWKTVPPERLSAAGYAEFHPAASNGTAAGRAKNRRVDIVVLPRTKIDFAGMAATTPRGPWRRITDDDADGQPAGKPGNRR